MSEDETLEKLFEKYISLKVHQIYTKKGYNVVLQSNKIYLFKNEQKYKIKPDIIIYSKERNDKVILDTKWKTLLDDSGKPDVSNSDIYQMYVYQKKTSARKVVLLFPMVEKLKEIHYTNADGIDISPYQIDMNDVENSVKNMDLF